jgi:DeoR/GlpR family transcriptional regulator of sugar metabolism
MLQPDHPTLFIVSSGSMLRLSSIAEHNDKRSNRAALILKELRQLGSVSVDALREKLKVSLATVRRDLQELKERGLLLRTHGGAVSIEPLFYEAFKGDRSFEDQVGSFAEEKRRIVQAASELVASGETIAITAGTTMTGVVRSLQGLSGITVITNTVNVAMELSKRKDIRTYLINIFRPDFCETGSAQGVFADLRWRAVGN